MAASPERGRGAPYAELHCLSNFSFLRGASQPAELVDRAHALGYHALALTDECSVAGVVRAHMRAPEQGLRSSSAPSSRSTAACAFVALAATRRGYGADLPADHRAAGALRPRAPTDSRARISPTCTAAGAAGSSEPDSLLLWRPPAVPDTGTIRQRAEQGRWLARHYPDALWLAVSLLRVARATRQLRDAARGTGRRSSGCAAWPAATCTCTSPGAARCRTRSPRSATACRCARPGSGCFPMASDICAQRAELARLYPAALLAETLRHRRALPLLARRTALPVSARDRAGGRRRRRATCGSSREEGAAERWPQGVPATVPRTDRARTRASSPSCEYEPFFLTVYDVVRFARERGILLPGPRLGRQFHRLLLPRRSPRWVRTSWRCCSSASSRANATSRRTSTSISSTSGARR